MKEIVVSVFVITFNQKNYISETLKSILAQETDFKYEVIVHDDCSSDGTREIVQQFFEKYPDKIRPIFQKENQFSKGNSPMQYLPAYANGKYIALCEGDDYWNNIHKLQLQVDAMERNLDCSLCVHDTQKISKDGKSVKGHFPSVKLNYGIIPTDEFMHMELVESPWLFHYSSFFIRKEIFEEFMECSKEVNEKFPVGDKPLLIFSAYRGNIFYINKNMSCYRTNCGVTTLLKKNIKKRIENEKKFIEGYSAFNTFTQNKYNEDIELLLHIKRANCLYYEGYYRELLSCEYKSSL